MKFDSRRRLALARRRRTAAALLTDLDGGACVLRERDDVEGDLQFVVAHSIGSRRATTRETGQGRLFFKKLSPVHAPIELDIEAVKPAEIAVAILAEIVQALRSPPLSPSGRR